MTRAHRAEAYKARQDIRGSTTERLKIKLRHPRTGQQALRAEKSLRERNYESLFSEGQRCLERLKEEEAQVDELQTAASNLTTLAVRHTELQGELSVLFKRVFDGPTPAYPEEDEAEDAVQAAELQVEEVGCALVTR